MVIGKKADTKDLAGAKGIQPRQLLKGHRLKVLGVLGGEDTEDALPLEIGEEPKPHHRGQHRRPSHGSQDEFAGKTRHKEHNHRNGGHHQGHAGIPLEQHHPHPDAGVDENRYQYPGVVQILPHLCQMPGEGEDKSNLPYLAGLHRGNPQIQPAAVVRAGAGIPKKGGPEHD